MAGINVLTDIILQSRQKPAHNRTENEMDSVSKDSAIEDLDKCSLSSTTDNSVSCNKDNSVSWNKDNSVSISTDNSVSSNNNPIFHVSRETRDIKNPPPVVRETEINRLLSPPWINDDRSCDSGISSNSNSSSGSADSTDSCSSQKPLLNSTHYPVSGEIHEQDIENPEPKTIPDVTCKSSTDNSFWCKVVVIFSVLDILLLASILLVRFGITKTDNTANFSSRYGHCLNCTDVYLTKDDITDNIYNFHIIKDGLCCADNETLLIQKYVLKRYRSDLAKESAKRYESLPKRTVLHLELNTLVDTSLNAGTDQVLEWKTEASLLSGQLTLSRDKTEIVIGRQGLYYISPRVVFDDKKGDVGDSTLVPMKLQVYRERSGETPQLLLENKETHCAHSETICAKPSSSQGVFKMEKGDRVVVKVTKPCGLVLKEKHNHIDVYMI